MDNKLKILERGGRVMLLAYDQGFEHGPVDFDEHSVNPEVIMKLGIEGGFTGIVLQEGVADKYYKELASEVKERLPLVVKLNGKTSFQEGEPLSLQLCTVKKALEMGASAVGYTIYVGSQHEEQMMVEFSRIEDEAHEAGIPVIGWMYPRGKKVIGKENSKEVLAYAARLGLELNADYVKIPYTLDPADFSWVIQAAGKTKVLIQGGKKMGWSELETEVRGALSMGATGVAIGRNVWQADDPLAVAAKLRQIVLK